jgi:hypothetical protein
VHNMEGPQAPPMDFVRPSNVKINQQIGYIVVFTSNLP